MKFVVYKKKWHFILMLFLNLNLKSYLKYLKSSISISISLKYYIIDLRGCRKRSDIVMIKISAKSFDASRIKNLEHVYFSGIPYECHCSRYLSLFENERRIHLICLYKR